MTRRTRVLVAMAAAGVVFTPIWLHPGQAPRLTAGASPLSAEIPSGAEADEHQGPADDLGLKEGSGQLVTLDQYQRARSQASAIPTGDPAPWQLVGPANVGGRVVDLALDPSTGTIYAAAASGGVWKSSDQGANWTPAWPADNTQAMGALARGSNGTLWAGTGEANPSGGGLTFFGTGLYKSSDGGGSWSLSGLADSGAFGRIVVNPNNANDVWAAAAGDISQQVTQRGIYHTTDGGQTWNLALAPVNDTTGGIDIALSPTDPGHVVYAALWDHQRNNGARTYGGVGSGLYKSTDDGATWTRIENTNISGSVCSWDATATGFKSDASLGRIGIAVAPTDANRVYIEFGSEYGPDKGFYISSDGGNTFACGGEAGASGAGYEWWFGRVWVDPLNEDILFNADVNLRESVDGGQHWAAVTMGTTGGANGGKPGDSHADQHAMVWDPNTAGRVYLGNDGGVYRSDENGAPETWIHGLYEPWNQIYHLAVAQDDPTRLAVGLQDQGSWATWTATSAPSDLSGGWTEYGGGDGHYVLIDPSDHTYYYECFQPSPPRNDCSMFHDTTSTSSSAFAQPSWPSNTRLTTDTPIAFDPSNPQVVYLGGTSLARSTNRGASFTVISPATPDDPSSLPGAVPTNEIDKGPFYA
ncbi:MAG: WD40/YVTN/BNR-like repeat-containing protein, partial [Candidatus Dormibacteria bacterium]